MSYIKQIGLLVILSAFLGAGYMGYTHFLAPEEKSGGQRRGFGPTLVEAVPAQNKRIESRIEAVGTTFARKAVQIVPMASGQITDVLFATGDTVKTGDILVRLDQDIQRADLDEAKARLAEATLARQRTETLAKSNTVSKAAMEQQTAALAIAQAQLDRAERRLIDRKVLAPFDGVVGLKQIEVGTRVDDKTIITSLDDLSEVEIEFSAPETIFGALKIGMEISAKASAFPLRDFKGRITSIDSRIDTLSRSFKARAQVPNEDLALPSGMFMHLTVILSARENLMIPEEALVAEGDKSLVFLLSEGKAKRQLVTIGERQFGSIEIVDGLQAGDQVITRGVQKLRNGKAVKLAGDGPPRGKKGGKPDAGKRPKGANGKGKPIAKPAKQAKRRE